MKKLTCSAIALTMTCAAGFASDSEWSALDQEVGALASTLSLDGGASISGLLQTAYMSDGDTDTGGWATGNARLAVNGSHGDYGYHVEADFADEGLRGAYATWGMTDSVSAQMGQFRASVCNDADTDEGSMKHFNHSAVGAAFTNFSSGLGLSGAMSDISWALSIMNGEDGTGDELATVLRASMDLMDGGEGGMDVSASVAIVDDSGVTDDAGATVIEVNAGNGTWGIGIETADAGAGGSGSLGNALEADSGCMVINLSYNIDANWEVAVRMTDLDDADGTEATEITANNYLDGHGLKWQIGMVEAESDAGLDTSAMLVGLTVAF
ncbi:MAG: hypothetical protein QF848_06505 [Planctomycetota bacterium]|jgi:hypothetical protein|nr:hypothetical protein [Planctomycetota bacterium]